MESVGDSAGTVFHVDNNEIVAGETGDLRECWREAEEEEAVKGLAISEAGLQGFRGRRKDGERVGIVVKG